MARRRRSLARQLERELVRYAKRDRRTAALTWRAGAADVEVVAKTFAVDPDWRRVEDGRAARLGPRETIEVSRHGRFADVDPRVVVVGWRKAGRALGLVTWAGAVGAGWWLGTKGHGPLRHLDDSR